MPGLDLTVVFDQAPFIEHSIEGLATEGLLGLLFAVVVILVFLVSVRSTLVTALSIPISVLVTFIGLNLGGHSLNMLTLGALTIAIGRVVRFFTIATVLKFFAPFALTVAIAMLSSLLVALTIVPVLSYWFLKAPTDVQDSEAVRAGAEEKEHRSWLQRGYKPVLRGTQKHPVITVVASALLLVLTVSLIPLLKVDFLGNTGQNMVMVTQTFDSGTDLESVSEGAEEVEDALAGVEGVEDIMLMAGSSGGGEGDFSALLGGGGGSATFIVNTDPDADQSALQEEVRTRLATLDGPGEVSLMDPASMGGFGGSVDVAVSSQNEEDLAEAAQAVQAALEGTPHTAELTSDLAADQPTVHVAVDRAAALEEGLTEMQLLGMVAGTLSPQSVGSVTMDGDAYDIYIEGTDAPETIAELQDMPVPTAAGMVPLTDLATVEEVTVPESVTRMDGDLALWYMNRLALARSVVITPSVS